MNETQIDIDILFKIIGKQVVNIEMMAMQIQKLEAEKTEKDVMLEKLEKSGKKK